MWIRRGVRLGAFVVVLGCGVDSVDTVEPEVQLAAQPAEPRIVAEGRQIFRYDDFGDWRFWTDTLRLNDLVETVTPAQALALGLKVDAAAVPADVLAAVLANPALLNDPATTRTLLTLNAVVGLVATVAGDQITRIGTTCALCHSTVDNSVAAGIGNSGLSPARARRTVEVATSRIGERRTRRGRTPTRLATRRRC
jgi:hypothetical protein